MGCLCVDFASGQPYRFIHEALRVVFPPDCFGEFDKGLAVYSAMWREYAPSYPLTMSSMKLGEQQLN